jgi:hypothetical protein
MSDEARDEQPTAGYPTNKLPLEEAVLTQLNAVGGRLAAFEAAVNLRLSAIEQEGRERYVALHRLIRDEFRTLDAKLDVLAVDLRRTRLDVHDLEEELHPRR